LTVLWTLGESIGKRPLLILGVMGVVVGVQILATGLIAELIVHLGAAQAPYVVRRRLVREAAAPALSTGPTLGVGGGSVNMTREVAS
jgi:hypothetical protein